MTDFDFTVISYSLERDSRYWTFVPPPPLRLGIGLRLLLSRISNRNRNPNPREGTKVQWRQEIYV